MQHHPWSDLLCKLLVLALGLAPGWAMAADGGTVAPSAVPSPYGQPSDYVPGLPYGVVSGPPNRPIQSVRPSGWPTSSNANTAPQAAAGNQPVARPTLNAPAQPAAAAKAPVAAPVARPRTSSTPTEPDLAGFSFAEESSPKPEPPAPGTAMPQAPPDPLLATEATRPKSALVVPLPNSEGVLSADPPVVGPEAASATASAGSRLVNPYQGPIPGDTLPAGRGISDAALNSRVPENGTLATGLDGDRLLTRLPAVLSESTPKTQPGPGPSASYVEATDTPAPRKPQPPAVPPPSSPGFVEVESFEASRQVSAAPAQTNPQPSPEARPQQPVPPPGFVQVQSSGPGQAPVLTPQQGGTRQAAQWEPLRQPASVAATVGQSAPQAQQGSLQQPAGVVADPDRGNETIWNGAPNQPAGVATTSDLSSRPTWNGTLRQPSGAIASPDRGTQTTNLVAMPDRSTSAEVWAESPRQPGNVVAAPDRGSQPTNLLGAPGPDLQNVKVPAVTIPANRPQAGTLAAQPRSTGGPSPYEETLPSAVVPLVGAVNTPDRAGMTIPTSAVSTGSQVLVNPYMVPAPETPSGTASNRTAAKATEPGATPAGSRPAAASPTSSQNPIQAQPQTQPRSQPQIQPQANAAPTQFPAVIPSPTGPATAGQPADPSATLRNPFVASPSNAAQANASQGPGTNRPFVPGEAQAPGSAAPPTQQPLPNNPDNRTVTAFPAVLPAVPQASPAGIRMASMPTSTQATPPPTTMVADASAAGPRNWPIVPAASAPAQAASPGGLALAQQYPTTTASPRASQAQPQAQPYAQPQPQAYAQPQSPSAGAASVDPTRALPLVPDPSAPAGAGESSDLKVCEGTQILARVGSDVIQACDLAGTVNEVMAKHFKDVPPQYVDQVRMQVTKQLLQPTIENKLAYLDAKRTIPAENVSKIEKDIGDQFEKSEVDRFMKAMGVGNRQEVDDKLRTMGTSLERERRAYIERMLARQWVHQKVRFEGEISHEELLAYYREHGPDYENPAKARWEELMVRFSKHARREEAFQIMADMGNKVLNGAPLAKVAKEQSEGPTSNEGGAYDWTRKGSLASKALDDALFGLPVGQLSQIIEDQQGLHIIRVVERVEAGKTSFVDAQVEIRDKLKKQKTDEQMKKYMEKLKKDVPVWTIFDQPGNDTPAAARRG